MFSGFADRMDLASLSSHISQQRQNVDLAQKHGSSGMGVYYDTKGQKRTTTDCRNHYSSADEVILQLAQTGQAIPGPGVLERKPLTDTQKAALHKAKKYAIELSLKNVIMKQSMVHQQQRVQSLQLAANKERAMSLMCRIYIGSVYYEANEDAVASMFSPFGPLKSVCMTWDNITGSATIFSRYIYRIGDKQVPLILIMIASLLI